VAACGDCHTPRGASGPIPGMYLAGNPTKATGEHVYIHNVRVPGMLHGRVVRPPVINTDPEVIDDSAAKKIPGFVQVVREGKFVGVRACEICHAA